MIKFVRRPSISFIVRNPIVNFGIGLGCKVAHENLLLRLDFHVLAWRVAEDFEFAVAGMARGDFPARTPRQPRIPVRPPGAGMLGSAFPPLLDLRRIGAVFSAVRSHTEFVV